ncbi:cell division protein ZapD [Candidatus Thiosymbion oneisti]|uniref:cell division protein ZapD n=1 Tax=Candidatus Thiosymbion oneisti TaxID=589554 RepID=UPI000AC12FC4|nr:cell division protein ZapD [Candidatus Thiosymbion oneisti]
MSTSLTFEYPLNERIRTFLRLEYLLEKVAHFLPQEDPWMSRVAVEGILDILTITTRGDIKTELLKELERNTNALNRMQREPEVDPKTLEKTLDDLRKAISDLHKSSGQIGQSLRQDGFLKSIAKRSSIPGGTCSFDIPQYHYWLRQPLKLRQQQLNDWMQSLQPASNGITLALSLARTSAEPREVTATGGFYQEALNIQAPAQLVRVTLKDGSHLFPEISGHKNRFSIRFMSVKETGRPTSWQKDTTFTLTCCVF